MTWEHGRQLSSLQTADNSVSYKYDSNGMRTQKDVDGTKTYYYYDNDKNLIGLTKGNYTLLFYYDLDGNVTSFKYNGAMYYYIKNLQSDVVKIINQSGTECVSYVYDAWGNTKSASGNPILRELNPFRYRSYVYDEETGLYYLQSRYYDPFTGRFLNADIYCDTQTGSPLSTNMFAYCENNHICRVDTSGNFWGKLISIVWSQGRLRAFTVAMAIDAIMFLIAGWLKVTWLGFMAPLKLMGKKTAARFFAKRIVPKIKNIANKIISIGVKALVWIGKKAFAGIFNLKAKLAISAILNEPMRVVSACTSIGGFIAAIWDYFSDRRFDGWIKI